MNTSEVAMVLAWLGTVFNLFMKASPLQTIRMMWIAESVGPRTNMFFAATWLNSVLWTTYGAIALSAPIMVCNSVGVIIFAAAQVVFLYLGHKEERRGRTLSQTTFAIALKMCILSFILGCAALAAGIALPRGTATIVLGSAGAGVAMIVYGAPLDVIRNIIATKSSEALTPFTVVSAVLCAAAWSLYAILVSDYFILVPNVVGFGLSLTQLFLMIVYPRTTCAKKCVENELSPAVNTSQNVVDDECSHGTVSALSGVIVSPPGPISVDQKMAVSGSSFSKYTMTERTGGAGSVTTVFGANSV